MMATRQLLDSAAKAIGGGLCSTGSLATLVTAIQAQAMARSSSSR